MTLHVNAPFKSYITIEDRDEQNAKNIGDKKMPARQNKNKSIVNELDQLRLPDDIKSEALDIFSQMGSPVKRGKAREALIFFLIYTAHHNQGHSPDPKVLGETLGLKSGEVTRALTQYSEAHTGYRPRYRDVTVYDVIPTMCSELGLVEVTNEIFDITSIVIENDPELDEKNFPHKFAAGIIKYYLTTIGYEINRDLFSEVVKFSDVTLKEMVAKVAQAHNR